MQEQAQTRLKSNKLIVFYLNHTSPSSPPFLFYFIFFILTTILCFKCNNCVMDTNFFNYNGILDNPCWWNYCL